MTIKEFAKSHRLRLKTDEVGDTIVQARHGQIYEHGAGRFGVMLMLKTVRSYNGRRNACEAAGMRVIQDGDTEGTLLFDPSDKTQARVAIRMVGAKIKRQLSPETAKAAAERLARFRESRNTASEPKQEGP